MTDDLLSNSIAFFICGLLLVLVKNEYLIRFTHIANRFKLFKLPEDDNFVTIQRMVGFGALIIGIAGIISKLLRFY